MIATTLHKQWEVLRCSNVACEHEHVREADGRATMPCNECHCEMYALALRPDYAADAERNGVTFSLDDMRQALGHAIRPASTLARTVEYRAQTQGAFLLRAEATGKAMAYQEALDMLEAATAAVTEGAARAADRGLLVRALIHAGDTVASMAELPPDDRRSVEAAVRSWRAWSAEATAAVTKGVGPEAGGGSHDGDRSAPAGDLAPLDGVDAT